MRVPIILMVAIFYFVLIRPERKKQKDRDTMLKALKKGDRVMTTSGILAKVISVREDEVKLEIADGVKRSAAYSVPPSPHACESCAAGIHASPLFRLRRRHAEHKHAIEKDTTPVVNPLDVAAEEDDDDWACIPAL